MTALSIWSTPGCSVGMWLAPSSTTMRFGAASRSKKRRLERDVGHAIDAGVREQDRAHAKVLGLDVRRGVHERAEEPRGHPACRRRADRSTQSFDELGLVRDAIHLRHVAHRQRQAVGDRRELLEEPEAGACRGASCARIPGAPRARAGRRASSRRGRRRACERAAAWYASRPPRLTPKSTTGRPSRAISASISAETQSIQSVVRRAARARPS